MGFFVEVITATCLVLLKNNGSLPSPATHVSVKRKRKKRRYNVSVEVLYRAFRRACAHAFQHVILSAATVIEVKILEVIHVFSYGRARVFAK